jgi:hypothetical protein
MRLLRIRGGGVVGTQCTRLQGQREPEPEHDGQQKPREKIASSLM